MIREEQQGLIRKEDKKVEKIVPIIDIPYNKIARESSCGDPARAEKISKRLDHVEVVAKSREYWTFNGTYKGVPVTVSSHGVGGNGASVSFEGLILGGAKSYYPCWNLWDFTERYAPGSTDYRHGRVPG